MEVLMENSYHKEIFDRIPRERRHKIIDVAVHEFAHKGFDDANINDIAAAAGISVGSLYKYFNTKEDLFLTCVQFGIETLQAVLDEVLASPGDLFAKTEKIVRIIQEHSRKHKNLIILYNEITSESNAHLTWKLAAKMEALSAGVYTALIRQAQEEGKVKMDISPGLFAFFLDNLFMMLQFSYSCSYYRERFKIYAGEDILERDELVVEQFMKFFRAALEEAGS
ncbi:MAG: TetR/AcrR family transcriptional regulator [Firmicutes bacterium]|jgi:AcrR family transcriptional regulator|nr:TetR/AcrR family transcriptional regulator [Bacillota bacterium]